MLARMVARFRQGGDSNGLGGASWVFVRAVREFLNLWRGAMFRGDWVTKKLR
jgi:hypothetical protein